MTLYKFWWTGLGDHVYDFIEAETRGKAKAAALSRVRAGYPEAKFTEIRIERRVSRES